MMGGKEGGREDQRLVARRKKGSGEELEKNEEGDRGNNSVIVMERTVKRREWMRAMESAMASLLGGLQLGVHYVSWAAHAHVTSQSVAARPERESNTVETKTLEWLDGWGRPGKIHTRKPVCNCANSVIELFGWFLRQLTDKVLLQTYNRI